jgi:hypothetical protein
MAENILLIGGSLNQTTMMHQIAKNLPEYNCFFTPFYAKGGLVGYLNQKGMVNFSILGGRHRKATEEYLRKQNLAVDFGGDGHSYDAVITCTDSIIQNNIRGNRLILVQEGMTEPEDIMFHLVRALKLPRYLANTSTTGLSNAYDLFCVASPGYRDLFVKKGAKPEKIVVTGIPNFDNAEEYLNNDFPYHNYALVATSSLRETLKPDFRMQFLYNARQLAAGQQVIFKLHPNEDIARARREIHSVFPDALIFEDGNLHHMIANSEILIAQSTSAVYTGIALGKKVHSYYDRATLHKLMPIQNHGKSAARIAEVCRQLVQMPQVELNQFRQTLRLNRKWRFSDAI